MKFSCYKDDLADALKAVMPAVAVKPQTPVLSGIYLKAEDAVLEVQATNYTNGIIAKIPVNTEESGEVVISGKKFQEFVANLPERTLTCSVEGKALTLESGSANVTLLTMTAADFPKVKTIDDASTFKIRSKVLHDLIRKTSFAAGKDKGERPIFTGCLFDYKDDFLTLVATNTHRLALAKYQLSINHEPFAFTVPAAALNNVINRIDTKDAENFVTVNFSNKHVAFTFDNVYMTVRLLEGTFPPYERIIPTGSTTRARVIVKEFKTAVGLIALIAKETEYNTVKLNITAAGIEISADSREVGDAVKTVDATVDGDDLNIAFNAAYLSDVLKVVDAPAINIAFNDKFSPAAVTVPGDDDYVYVVTPVRT